MSGCRYFCGGVLPIILTIMGTIAYLVGTILPWQAEQQTLYLNRITEPTREFTFVDSLQAFSNMYFPEQTIVDFGTPRLSAIVSNRRVSARTWKTGACDLSYKYEDSSSIFGFHDCPVYGSYNDWNDVDGTFFNIDLTDAVNTMVTGQAWALVSTLGAAVAVVFSILRLCKPSFKCFDITFYLAIGFSILAPIIGFAYFASKFPDHIFNAYNAPGSGISCDPQGFGACFSAFGAYEVFFPQVAGVSREVILFPVGALVLICCMSLFLFTACCAPCRPTPSTYAAPVDGQYHILLDDQAAHNNPNNQVRYPVNNRSNVNYA